MNSVEVISPVPRHVWDELLQMDQEALVSQSPDWTEATCVSGGYKDASRLYIFPDGQRIVLPLVERKILASASTSASMPPAWDVGGALSDRPRTSEALAEVFRDLAVLSYLQIRIRPNPLRSHLWESAAGGNVIRISRRSHVLNVEDGFEMVWRTRFCSSARNAANKAERRGVTIECDSTGRLVPVFYDLFHKAVRRWASIQNEPVALARARAYHRDPIEKFEAIMKLMRGACRIWSPE